MKRFLVFIFVLAMCCLTFVGCDTTRDEVQSIRVSEEALASYECTLNIESRAAHTGEEPAVFKSTITPADITLSKALEGKTVKSVKFIDQSNIQVVLEGKTKTLPGEDDYGIITISHKALENDYDAFTDVTVRRATVTATTDSGALVSGKYSATYQLNAGSFTDKATTEHIRLAEGSDGTITSVGLKDGKLTVTVEGATQRPTLAFDAEVTTIAKAFTIGMAASNHATLE